MGVVLLCSLLRLMVKQSQGSAAPRQPCSSRRFTSPRDTEALPNPPGQLTAVALRGVGEAQPHILFTFLKFHK